MIMSASNVAIEALEVNQLGCIFKTSMPGKKMNGYEKESVVNVELTFPRYSSISSTTLDSMIRELTRRFEQHYHLKNIKYENREQRHQFDIQTSHFARSETGIVRHRIDITSIITQSMLRISNCVNCAKMSKRMHQQQYSTLTMHIEKSTIPTRKIWKIFSRIFQTTYLEDRILKVILIQMLIKNWKKLNNNKIIILSVY